jgi:ATP-dependent exoDNAse (exonuclease V) beta subunit
LELNVGQRLALAIDMHLILDAGAGTGKTQSIVGRAIEHYLSVDQRATRLLPPGPRPLPLAAGSLRIGLAEREDLTQWQGLLPSEVVVLTFTTRAAEEMRHRLWKELNRLRPGPTLDDGGHRRDSRVTHEGLIDQLTAMLEDAPIGTIDSFLSRLIAPWRADLAQRPTDEVVGNAERHVLLEQALEGLWRLRTAGDAVAAGVSGERAPFLIESRDRLARRFGNRKAVRTVLSSLLSNRIFVDTVARKLESDGNVGPDDVHRLIEEILSPADSYFDTFIDEIHQVCLEWVNHVRTYGKKLGTKEALEGINRFRTLAEMVDIGPPATRWERWLWLHGLCMVTCTTSSHQSTKVSAFSGGNLTNSADWPRGIATWGAVSEDHAKQLAKDLGVAIAECWNGSEGRSFRPLARAIYLLDDTSFEVPHMPVVDSLNPQKVASPLPHSSPGANLAFGIEEEASHLQDMLLCHRSLLDILHELKVREGVHEFDDVASLAADLLLARCPRIMRADYPIEVVHALDALPDETWSDEHIQVALSLMEGIAKDPESAGLDSTEAKRLLEDLQSRHSRLRDIRSRYRAFIIDEAQDNSAQQWRLLGRLWGPRNLPDGTPPPDTPWEPTVCCVGDRKQSIYAFRQAQVSGFVDFGKALRNMNEHEFHSLPALTRSPELRRQNAARDPRYSADGGFATASDLPESRSQAEGAWVRFDESEQGSSNPVDSLARSQGHVELVVNYRTAAGLLNQMNGWWEDIFSPNHDRFPGDWYARPQALLPARTNVDGRFEWLVPASTSNSGHANPDLALSLDPFSSGSSSEMENALITARIRSLLDNTTTRVGETEQPKCGSYSPGEILVLLPSRSKLEDLMTRLEAAGIPAVADKEGGLLLRPVIRPLLGLLQWIARPSSRHAAATVSRSCLVALNDQELQKFLGEATTGENLIQRLAEILPEGPHRILVERWLYHSQYGTVVESLHEVLNHSDLLLSHPRPSERNDAEQFLRIIENQSSEVGGDPVLLADCLAHLANIAGNDLTSSGVSTADAVQVMTIHGSKGLQRKCVIVGGLFSEGQGNISHDLRQRVIATPSLFSSNPRPWITQSSLDSGVWTLARTLQEAQIQAEARRLFYVACTRVKDLLILAGGPNDSTRIDDVISMKLRTLPMPTFGHMWFEALGWEPEEDGRHLIDPKSLPFAVHCHESELGGTSTVISPLVRMARLNESAQIAHESVSPSQSTQVPTRTRGIRISPHQLDKAATCPRCYLQLMRLGLTPDAVSSYTSTDSTQSAAERIGLPPANVIGSIFHRVIEIGLENPGLQSEISVPLPPQWTEQSPNLLEDEGVIQAAIEELLPPDADVEAMKSLLRQMSKAVIDGPLGTLTAGDYWGGEVVEGLRTEWPFSLQHSLEVSADDHIWTPHGSHQLASILQFVFSSTGITDLVLCTRLDDGSGAIRAIDFKTTGAAHLYAGWPHPLLEAEGDSRHESEQEMLDDYRMQLALYTLTLIRQEQARERVGIPHRKVQPPGILCTTTGRMILMTEDEMDSALNDLDNLFQEIAELALQDGVEQECECALNLGNLRLFSNSINESVEE